MIREERRPHQETQANMLIISIIILVVDFIFVPLSYDSHQSRLPASAEIRRKRLENLDANPFSQP